MFQVSFEILSIKTKDLDNETISAFLTPIGALTIIGDSTVYNVFLELNQGVQLFRIFSWRYKKCFEAVTEVDIELTKLNNLVKKIENEESSDILSVIKKSISNKYYETIDKVRKIKNDFPIFSKETSILASKDKELANIRVDVIYSAKEIIDMFLVLGNIHPNNKGEYQEILDRATKNFYPYSSYVRKLEVDKAEIKSD